jgi:two-component system phosphate regulon sensor histidine kinase PhoR
MCIFGGFVKKWAIAERASKPSSASVTDLLPQNEYFPMPTPSSSALMSNSSNNLSSLLAATREGVVVVDPILRVIAANAPATRAFARNGSELTGRRLSEVIREFRLHDSFQRAITNGESSDITIDFTVTERRIFDVHVSPIDHANTRHAIGFFYDITQVERLEKMRQEFLSNISHELRTPLTSIIAFVETLEDGAIDDKENNRRFLSVIRRNSERMHSLISDISELSMIESGNISIEKNHVRLSNIVEEVFASLSSQAAERNVSLINNAPVDARVFADQGRLEQMITNLVDNAIKFNVTGGSVSISLEERPDRSIIQIADTGEGIVPEQLGRIFERFYRIDRARTRDVGGTGLGLAIVKHLAKLHGGEISVVSQLGKGTVFSVELPVV